MVSWTLHIKLEASNIQEDVPELRCYGQFLEGNGRREPKTAFQLEELGQHQINDP
jgi:hypothetical protein